MWQTHVTLGEKARAIPLQETWRELFEQVLKDFTDVRRGAMSVDAAAMWMVLKPEQFDVVVTTNLFGDILSDLGAALAASPADPSCGHTSIASVHKYVLISIIAMSA